jgi:hypothetical protein
MRITPVNILGYRLHPDATRGRDVALTVDDCSLTDILEQAIPESSTERSWLQKADVRVIPKALKASLKSPRDRTVLTCAHCGFAECISLKPFEIRHQGQFIVWRMAPPGADLWFRGDHSVELRFARSEYENTVKKLMQREPVQPRRG